MKKTILSSLAVVAIAATIFVSCNKEAVETNSKVKPNIATVSSSCASLDFQALDIGLLHNQTVMDALSGLDMSDPSSKDDVITYLESLSFDATPLGYSNYEDFLDDVIATNTQLSSYGYDIMNWTTHPIHSTPAAPYVADISTAIDNYSTISGLNTTLDNIQAQANANLTCEDLDIITGAIIIAKSSAYLWSSASMGGLGYFEDLYPDYDPISTGRSIGEAIKGAVMGDVGASFSYFGGLGISAVIGGSLTPGTNVAILGGWAISAGFGSVGGATGWF